MNMSSYRKLVLASADVKGAKIGFGLVAKNSKQANLIPSVLVLGAQVNALIEDVAPYLLGAQFEGQAHAAIENDLQEIGRLVVMLAKILKVKLSTPTKKVKLENSRAYNLLYLQSETNHMVGIALGQLIAPPTVTVQKEQVMPSKGGAKEMRSARVVDKAALAEHIASTIPSFASHLNNIAHTFWGLVYDMYKKPPMYLFEANYAVLGGVDEVAAPAPVVEAAPVAKAKAAKKTKAVQSAAA